MSSTVIIGAQWGDEGKGKIIDIFAEEADVIVRYQGGNNAGHTIVIDDKEFILHLIPSGILREDKICVIGHGVVLNPEAFLRELEYLKVNGVNVKGRVYISETTHMIMPYHLYIDSASEKEYKIGTTMRGVGPAYEDKIGRHGIRAIDLLDTVVFKEKLQRNLKMKSYILGNVFDYDQILEEYLRYGEILKEYIKDTALFLSEALKNDKKTSF